MNRYRMLVGFLVAAGCSGGTSDVADLAVADEATGVDLSSSDLAMWAPATRFAAMSESWRLPNTGLTNGFTVVEQSAPGAGSWAMRDLNGDGRPDLVMTRDQTNAIFGTAAAQTWHVYLNTGNDFSNAATDWALPDAGLTKGFYVVEESAADVGSWALLDMDGDGKPDLVMTRDQANAIYGTAAAQKWHVYLNTGTAFSTTATDWAMPDAGLTKGFDLVQQSAAGVGSWAVRDMDGDGKPDLVMTRDQANAIYGTAAAQKWHVYLNTGTAFSTTATDWAMPDAGLTKGFDLVDQSASGAGSWTTLDLNGDKRPDLVMTRDQTDAIYGSAVLNQKWHVYLSTGSGFSAMATDWAVPYAALTKGFDLTERTADGVGSWATRDLDGDGRPDLVLMRNKADAIFGTAGAQLWQLYPNTGSGFAATAQSWPLPNAGLTKGFYTLDQPAAGVGSWATLDVTGDRKPDLVMTRTQTDAIYGTATAQVWHVYRGL